MIHLLLFLLPLTHANTLENLYLEKLRRARTPLEVRRLHSYYDDLRAQRRICHLQLDQEIIPSACYRVVSRERNWRLVESAKAKETTAWLDEKCRRAAGRERSEALELRPSDERELSKSCRQTLNEARDIENYRVAKPRGLFSWPEF